MPIEKPLVRTERERLEAEVWWNDDQADNYQAKADRYRERAKACRRMIENLKE